MHNSPNTVIVAPSLLGADLARSLGVHLGERITVIAPQGLVTPAGVVPRLRSFRVVADHMRTATFILGDPRGVSPSNVDQGYVLRRLLRRRPRLRRRLLPGSFRQAAPFRGWDSARPTPLQGRRVA